MSENRVRKSCRRFYINPREVQKYQQTRKAVILADSKGKYIEREIITEHCLNIKFIWKKGWKVQQCIDWAEKHLTETLDSSEAYIFYIWLGTCDVTRLEQRTRKIELEALDDRNIR